MRNVITTAARRARSRVSGVVLLAILLAVAGTLVVSVTLAGGAALYTELDRGVPGEFTSVTSACLNLIAMVASTVCVGGLFYAAFLRAPTGRDRLFVDNARDLAVVRTSSAVWAISAVLLIAVDAADSNGEPLSKLTQPGALSYLFQASYPPGAWLVAAVCGGIVFCGAAFAQRWQTTVLLLGIALLGVLAPVAVGQILVGPNHDFGSDATFIGLPALTILFGSTLIVLARWRSGHAVSDTTVRRYLHASTVCAAIALCSLAVVAAFETAGTPLLSTPTGVMLAAQLILLVLFSIALLAARVRYRRGGLALAAVHPAVGHATAAATVLAIGLYLGLSVAMSRVPPPVFFVPTSISDLFFGYNIPSAPTLNTLVFDWRINLLFFVPTITAMAVYAFGVRRLYRRGDAWPGAESLPGCSAASSSSSPRRLRSARTPAPRSACT